MGSTWLPKSVGARLEEHPYVRIAEPSLDPELFDEWHTPPLGYICRRLPGRSSACVQELYFAKRPIAVPTAPAASVVQRLPCPPSARMKA